MSGSSCFLTLPALLQHTSLPYNYTFLMDGAFNPDKSPRIAPPDASPTRRLFPPLPSWLTHIACRLSDSFIIISVRALEFIYTVSLRPRLHKSTFLAF